MEIYILKESLYRKYFKNVQEDNFISKFSSEKPFYLPKILALSPKMLSKIADNLGKEGANIENMLNKSRNDIAYTVADMNTKPLDEALDAIRNLNGVIRVEVFEKLN